MSTPDPFAPGVGTVVPEAPPAVERDPATEQLEQAVQAPGDAPRVGLVVDTDEHAALLEPAELVLEQHRVSFEVRVVADQDGPDALEAYAQNAEMRGLRVLVGAAGAPVRLPEVLAAASTLPVLGVALDGATPPVPTATTPVSFVADGDVTAAALVAVRIVAGATPGPETA